MRALGSFVLAVATLGAAPSAQTAAGQPIAGVIGKGTSFADIARPKAGEWPDL